VRRVVVAGAVLLATTVDGPVGIIAGAAAQEAAKVTSYKIPAGPLSEALTAFGRQSGLQVTFLAAVAAGKSSPGVSGTMSPTAALAQLLSGTGLSFEMNGAKTVIVSKPAEGAGATLAGAIALDTIDVSGGGAAADEPYRTPGSVSYVSSEQLERVPATTPGDMFGSVPGVDIRGNHNGAQMDVAIRGQHGNNRVKVMVEGTQQDTSSHQGYNGQDNQTFVDQDLISSISVEKGAPAGPYGAGVTGGVVNMRTLAADDILLPGKEFGFRLRGSLMSNVTDDAPAAGTAALNYDRGSLLDFLGQSGSLAMAAKTNSLELVAAVTKREHGNYFAGKNGNSRYGRESYQVYSPIAPGAEVFDTSEDSRSKLLKGSFNFGGGHSFEAGWLRTESDYGWIYPIDTANAYSFIQNKLNAMQSDRAWSHYKWNPDDNDLINLQANLWKSSLIKSLTGDLQNNRNTDVDSWGTEAWNESRIDGPFGHFAVTYGVEYAKEDALIDGGYLGNAATREVGSLFSDAKWSPFEWVTLNGGLRRTWFETSGSYQESWGSFRVMSGHLEGHDVTPSAGVTFNLPKGIQVFTQYSEAYRPPSIREVAPQAAVGYPANPFLRPERSRNVEVGANLLQRGVIESEDVVRAKVAYFNNRYEDYITIISPRPYYYNNIPGAKIDGIEVSGSYKNGLVFVEADFNYYTTFEYCYRTDDPYTFNPYNKGCTQYLGGGGLVYGLSVPPKYSGSVTLGTTLLDDKLTVGATGRFFSKSAVPWKLPNGDFVFDAPMWRPDTIVDLFASYKLSDQYDLAASVENVFDRYYLDPMFIAHMPAPGRTGRLTFTARF